MDGQMFYSQTAIAIAGYLRQELNITPEVHYRFVEATSGPRVLVLTMVVNPRFASKIMGMSEQLSMAAGMDREMSIRIARGRRGTLSMEVPKPKGLWYNVAVSALPRRRWLTTSMGFDGEFRPALVDFDNPLTPHCLVAGSTGSGKTNVQRLIIFDLASQNGPEAVRFILIDTRKRGTGWQPFAYLPHLLCPVITDDLTAMRALSWAVGEIDRRASERRNTPRIFVGIDEAQALLEREPFVRQVEDLTSVGREFGVHVVLSAQNPTAAQLGDSNVKRNLAVRLVGRVDSATAATVATGQADTGAERLAGAGDMLLVRPDDVRRITAALLTEGDTARLPRVEAPAALDWGEYEDADHVADQADVRGKVGRRADPLDLFLVGRLAGMLARTPALSDKTLSNKLGIFVGKIARHRTAADEVLRGLRAELASG